jgi:oxygen-independent coproporphyrinogen-3 oxidase
MAVFSIDLEMIRKYDRPGPRYTSYPPAPHFHEKFTHAEFEAAIRRSNVGENLPHLSLYFHIPYCDTLCYFCGCNMIVTRNRKRVQTYLGYLKKEVELVRRLLRPERKVEQLHWGGGTPTHLTPEEIRELSTFTNLRFEFTSDAERGCEIDPRGLTREHLEALKEGGFNRISMGVQDFNEKVQRAVNRIQPEEMTLQVVKWVRELGFQSLNIDLIYGLPHQTLDSFAETVDRIVEIAPERLAVFNFAYVPWMKKHQKIIDPETLPPPEEKLQILKMTIEKLTRAGYVFIGMDHFAKPDDELAVALREKKLYRNFQGYSTHAGADLYAFGITSISQLPDIYAQNVKTEKEYYRALDAGRFATLKGFQLTRDDQLRRTVIMRLMCDFELNMTEIEQQFGIRFREYFAWGLEQLKEMEEDGLVEITESTIRVSEMGRLLIRNIAMNFDGFIERKQDPLRYSRTI